MRSDVFLQYLAVKVSDLELPETLFETGEVTSILLDRRCPLILQVETLERLYAGRDQRAVCVILELGYEVLDRIEDGLASGIAMTGLQAALGEFEVPGLIDRNPSPAVLADKADAVSVGGFKAAVLPLVGGGLPW